MRYTVFLTSLILSVGSTCSLSGQVLTRAHNQPRPGDVLEKQMVRHYASEHVGKDVVWDIADIEDEGMLRESYTGNIDSVFSLLSPLSAYNYRLSSDSLLCIGYTAPNLQISYLRPQLSLRYPYTYGDSLSSFHYGEGMYSHKLHMVVYGQSWCKADAQGVMVLPGGDTLRHVLRLHEHTLLGQRLSPDRSVLSLGDSTVASSDTVLMRLDTDSVTWTVDSYRWYAAGYRYPILETVETSINMQGEECPYVRRTFYTPADAQTYLEDDDENATLREMLAEQDRASATDSMRGSRNGYSDGTAKQQRNDNYTCSCNLSADGTKLDVQMYFENEHEVQLQVSTVQGYVIARSPKRRVQGTLHETFNLSSARHNVYMLSVILDGEVNSEKVIKQQ